MENLVRVDPAVAEAIRNETRRQGSQLELIASENFVSEAVLEALGTVLTNKYAEGYPGKRYYGGCEFVDVVERAAIARAKALFGADHVNVQPHSGAQANMAVYMSLLKPGDILAHPFTRHPGGFVNREGRVHPIVKEALARGLKTDVGRLAEIGNRGVDLLLGDSTNAERPGVTGLPSEPTALVSRKRKNT